MKKIILAVFLIAATSLRAQVSYSIIKNKPKESPNMLISVIPLSIDVSEQFNLSVIPSLTFRLPNERFFVDAYLKYAYAQVKDDGTKPGDQSGTPVNPIKNLTAFGAVLTYNFKVEETEKNHKVRIANKLFTYVPAQAIKCTGVRLGVESSTSFQHYANGITGVVPDLNNMPVAYSTSGTYFSNVHVFALVAGISRTRIEELEIDIDEGEHKTKKGWKAGNHRMVRLYADLMFAPTIAFGNISVPITPLIDSTTGVLSYSNPHTVVLTNMPKLPVGARVGYDVFTSKKFGWAYGLEASLRPGYTSGVLNNLFLTFKIGCNVAFRVGKKVEKEKKTKKK
jgi:hypothetical protein